MTARGDDASVERAGGAWLWLSCVALVGWGVSLIGGGVLLFYLRPEPGWYAEDLWVVRESWGGAIAVHAAGGFVALAALLVATVAPGTPAVVRAGDALASVCILGLVVTGRILGPDLTEAFVAPPNVLVHYLLHAAVLPFVASASGLACFFLGLRERAGR